MIYMKYQALIILKVMNYIEKNVISYRHFKR